MTGSWGDYCPYGSCINRSTWKLVVKFTVALNVLEQRPSPCAWPHDVTRATAEAMLSADMTDQKPDPVGVLLVMQLLQFSSQSKPLEEIRREVRAVGRQVRQVRQEIKRWEKEAASTATRLLDVRLRPFALALGRLLASDVIRSPTLSRKS